MKGNEGLDFTIHPQISNVYQHSRRKDEGMKGKFAFRLKKKSSYKDFSKIYHIYFYRNTATINFYNKEIREQNAKQIFLVSSSLQSA